MSCADVCISHDYDRSAEFYTEKMVTARKPHVCCECSVRILPGNRYERASGKHDGNIWTETTCALCSEVRHAFVCHSWVFGQLWESIEEEMFPIWNERGPLDCLAKLTTLEARNLCRDRYAEWRNDE
jgi:hypothetical protein